MREHNALAFEWLGHFSKKEVFDTLSEDKIYTIKIVAASSASEEGVTIAKASSLLFSKQKKSFPSSMSLLVKALDEYRRILSALYEEGRYGAVISIKINAREVADIPSDTEFPHHVMILVTINGGPLYHFGLARIHVVHFSGSQSWPMLLGDYVRGGIAKSVTILEAEKLIVDAWKEKGYAKARILKRDVVADHAAKIVDVCITLEPGELAYFGKLRIQNLSASPRIDLSYIAWMSGLRSGQRYAPDLLAQASFRLRRLGVFSATALNEADTIQEDGSLPLNLVLQERSPRHFGLGAFYSTLDGGGLEGYWQHRNLFGHAESLRLETRISGIGAHHPFFDDSQNYSYLFEMIFLRPGIFTPDTNYTVSFKGEHEVLERDISRDLYLRNGFTHIFSKIVSGYSYINVMRVKTEDDSFKNRIFSFFGLLGGLLYDSRDNKVDAHNGFYSELVANSLYEAQYRNFIDKFTLEGRTYLGIDKYDRFVAALRAKFGLITGARISELPSSLLFFTGGGGSVRGHAYAHSGLSRNGGLFLAESSFEMRTEITNNIGLVFFVDSGVTGKGSVCDHNHNMKIGIGFGVRYKTAVGPIRLDFAVPFNPEKGDSHFGFYIGIGQAF
ncbi:MAG: translocation and assembly module TamA [Candidatus Tokpelaia sp. JSC161]|jgi:translocation and assembly module TamA|nr:MAG: translocation and assembly module TamA [Candidatus Tokpelaia sp. JSC161]